MYKVTIYGAGSIGNHLAHACRGRDWDVSICDIDPKALARTKEQIYPERYGQWDDQIRLAQAGEELDEKVDLVIIGTPPDTHVELAIRLIQQRAPRVILIEKPLCPPSLEQVQTLRDLAQSNGTFIGVGYNHAFTQNTQFMGQWLRAHDIGHPLSLSVNWLEHWEGIFNAHPWLQGPQDTYLGFSHRGGGACGEHSHAIHLWQHVACDLLKAGRIVEVEAMMDMVRDGLLEYDRLCQLHVRTEEGLVGRIVQDVITHPAQKALRLQSERGYVEWHANYDAGHDAVMCQQESQSVTRRLISKTRPDDFKGEIKHLQDILDGNRKGSPIELDRGLETMLVIAAAHTAARSGTKVRIDYSVGYSPQAIIPVQEPCTGLVG